MKINRTVAALAVTIALLAQPAAALASDTGDDPRPTKNVTTVLDGRVEAGYQAWLRRFAPASKGTLKSGPTIIDAPYKYFYTPTHMQETNYYCGPATVQMIDDYWGTPATQTEIAKYLGTYTSHSTDFSLVDNAINKFAGQDYVYYGPCASSTDFYSRVAYGLSTRNHPMAIDMRVDGDTINYYVYDHDGHIVVLEAFDWRYDTVRLNDPYNEVDWRTGGGATGGHTTYPKSQIASAVMNHPRRAVVY